MDTLGINFTFPGFESILLVQNGNEKVVSIENVNEYTEAFAMKFFRDSIRLQVESFREGFNKVTYIMNYDFILFWNRFSISITLNASKRRK